VIDLTLEEGEKISIRPAAIRTVQAAANNFTLVTLDDSEMYIVRESREQITNMIESAKRQRRGKPRAARR
jgi:uncharacterized protein YlzI (FlbEa/FlbD family)